MSWLMVSEIAVTFFVMPIVAVMPLMTLQYFNGTPYQVSLIEMLFGIGLLVGGSILGVWNPKIRKSDLAYYRILPDWACLWLYAERCLPPILLRMLC